MEKKKYRLVPCNNRNCPNPRGYCNAYEPDNPEARSYTYTRVYCHLGLVVQHDLFENEK